MTYTDNMLSPNPAENWRTEFPSSVALKPLMKHSVRTTSSGGTGPTWALDTSPLSASDSPIEAARIEHSNRKKIQTNHRVVYNGSHHERPKPSVSSINGKKSNKEVSSYSYHQPKMNSSRYPSGSSTPAHKNKTKTKKHEVLTWRMDPSLSLSDFTLTIIGINDKDAVEKYIASKKKRQHKKQSKGDGTWMEDKLYLDMSEDENNANNDDCYNTVNDREDHKEHRGDTHVRSSHCNYPVVEKYYLHKTSLAVGSRSCDYFARLFQKKKNKKVSCNSHLIEVPVSCLPAIPAILDYIYNTDLNTPVHATTATAIPLRYLGTLLGNRSLFDSATHFLQTDLRPETTVEYLKHADLYQQKKLVEVCIRLCAENFDHLKITWLASLSSNLMKRILYSRYFKTTIGSELLSSKLASYCRCQLHKIDTSTLLFLTNTKIMPIVCPQEALFYIQIMIRLGMNMEDKRAKSLYDRCIDASPDIVQLVCQERGSITDEVDGLYTIKTSQTSRLIRTARVDYSRLPPNVKVDLLEYALAKQIE